MTNLLTYNRPVGQPLVSRETQGELGNQKEVFHDNEALFGESSEQVSTEVARGEGLSNQRNCRTHALEGQRHSFPSYGVQESGAVPDQKKARLGGVSKFWNEKKSCDKIRLVLV